MTNKAYVLGTVVNPDDLNDFNTATYNLLTAVAGTNTITATGPLSFSAYAAGKDFEFVPAVTNTGAVTINISGLGARAITKTGSTPLVAGDLVAGTVAKLVDDGTRFQLINPQTISVNLATQVTGTLPATNGGTGQNSYAVGDLLYANTTTTLAKLPDVAIGSVLRSGGVNTAPAWGQVNLATDILGAAWTTFATVMTSTTGTITSTTAVSMKYVKIGRLVIFTCTGAIVNNGTGAGGIQFTLPFTSANATVVNGRETNSSGSTIAGSISAGSTVMTVVTYNNGYPGGNGAVPTLSGTYESTT